MYLLLLCHSSRENNISLQGNMSGTTIGQPKNVYTYFLMLYKNADGVEEEREADNLVWPSTQDLAPELFPARFAEGHLGFMSVLWGLG